MTQLNSHNLETPILKANICVEKKFSFFSNCQNITREATFLVWLTLKLEIQFLWNIETWLALYAVLQLTLVTNLQNFDKEVTILYQNQCYALVMCEWNGWEEQICNCSCKSWFPLPFTEYMLDKSDKAYFLFLHLNKCRDWDLGRKYIIFRYMMMAKCTSSSLEFYHCEEVCRWRCGSLQYFSINT